MKNSPPEFSGGYDSISLCVSLPNYADGFEDKVLVPIDKTKIKERVIFVGIRRIQNHVLQSDDNARETSVSMKNLTLIRKIE